MTLAPVGARVGKTEFSVPKTHKRAKTGRVNMVRP
jgi:hypothetical protein